MGQYKSEARHHLERIQYFHENAGPKGYKQAEYHYNKLARLLMAAQRSKKNQNNADYFNLIDSLLILNDLTLPPTSQ